MNDVLFDVLQTVVAHATDKEPAPNVFILLLHHWPLALCTSVDIDTGEMAREFALVLRNESPLRELFRFGTLDKEPSDFVAAEFKPKHIVGQVQVKVVLFRVLLEQLTLSHQVLL